MVSKCLEKKIELLPDDSHEDLSSSIELEYYLVESEGLEIGDYQADKVYGIEIVKKVNNSNIERKFVKNFSCCKNSTKAILDKLVSNVVTPVELPFILDDLLGV